MTATTKGKYHISADGVARPCRATNGNCKFGGASGAENHYDTAAQAQAAYEVSQGTGVTAGKKRKPSAATSATPTTGTLKDRIDDLNAEADEFRANIIRLRKSIERDIEREQGRINNISRIKTELALDEFKARGKALFQDVDSAAAFYNLAWELGNSSGNDAESRAMGDAMNARFDTDNTYITDDRFGNWQSTAGYTQYVKNAQIAVPRAAKLEDDKLAQTADELEPIVRTNAKIMGGKTQVNILENTLSEHGIYTVAVTAENEAQSEFSYQLVKTSYGSTYPVTDKRDNLRDALKDVSDRCHYSSVDDDEEETDDYDDYGWDSSVY